jgi:hypothetical protein
LNRSELWVPLIEKAYAKLFGCYQSLIEGYIDDALMDLSSLVCEKLKLHNKNEEFDENKMKSDDFWNYL